MKPSRKEIYTLFSLVKNPDEVALLFHDMLTTQEVRSLDERLQIFKMLLEGIPQRTISKKLKVSIAKVTRGSHALRVSKGAIRRLLQRIKS